MLHMYPLLNLLFHQAVLQQPERGGEGAAAAGAVRADDEARRRGHHHHLRHRPGAQFTRYLELRAAKLGQVLGLFQY